MNPMNDNDKVTESVTVVNGVVIVRSGSVLLRLSGKKAQQLGEMLFRKGREADDDTFVP